MEKKLIELNIESLAFEGGGFVRHDGIPIFVRNAIPGDKILANIVRQKKKFINAEIEQILLASKSRITPPCKYFGECGGCTLQNMVYPEQTFWKRKFVIDSLTHIAKLGDIEVLPTITSPLEYHYRNKMEFSFSASRWLMLSEINTDEKIIDKDFALGLHSPKNYMKVLNIDDCLIAPLGTQKILEIVRDSALQNNLQAFNSKTHNGFLKNLVVRYSSFEDKLLLILITNTPKSDDEKNYAEYLSEKLFSEIPNLKGFILATNSKVSNVAIGDIEKIYGEKDLIEEILGLKYRISPFSFFQTNSFQLNQFISSIIEIAEPKNDEIIYDFYCGTGSITLPMSKKCKSIYGFESYAHSIEDAKNNAEINNIENANFQVLDLSSKNLINEFTAFPKPDTIILDPPRSGLHKNTVEGLIQISPEKIIYVSCNPATLARDLEKFKEFYSVEVVQPIDMFPQTYHIETIIKLNKK